MHFCFVLLKLCRQIGAHLRYCIGEVTAPELEFKCEHCDMSFDTKTGCGVHYQKAHKVEYNRALPTKKVFAWEDREIEALAKYEVELRRARTPRVNITLQQSFQHRTVEGIATVKKGDRYKAAFRNATEAASRTHEEGASEVNICRTPEEGDSDLTVNIPDTVPNEWWMVDDSLEVILDQTPSEAESLVRRWIENMERASHPNEADETVRDYANGKISWVECKDDLAKLVPTRVRKRKVRVQTILNRRENRDTAKYRKFRFLQRQYGRRRKMTISRIVKGTFSYENVPEVYPSAERVEAVYVGRLENESRSDVSVVNPH